MKIDIFTHIVPTGFAEAIKRIVPDSPAAKHIDSVIRQVPTMSDLDERFRIMDKYPDYAQVLTIGSAHEVIFGEKAPELAKIANDEMAELVLRYPDRFVAAIATVPMNDMDACLAEVDRAVNDLHMRGIMLWACWEDKPLDAPEYLPLYERMCQHNLPILIHPHRGINTPDYKGEKESRYNIFSCFGWVYETTVAMTRLVFSQVLEKYPDVKVLTHHCGAMVPFLGERIISHSDIMEMRRGMHHTRGMTKHPVDYYRMFYNDTAINGNTAGLECGYDFFGAEHILFGTDMPFDCQNGNLSISKTIQSVEKMDIPDTDKEKIFEGNARKLFRLPV